MILACQKIEKAFGGKSVLNNVNFLINEGEKAAVIGINGAGKTTLFKIITGEYEADNGEVIFQKGSTYGYLSQVIDVSSHRSIYEEMLDAKKEIIEMEKKIRQLEKDISTLSGEALESAMESYSRLTDRFEKANGYAWKSEITGVLKGLGFDESQFATPIHTLSGGQKTRVALSRILLMHPDLILLDEPTNHMDIPAKETLESAFKAYTGTMLFVSHDRYFIKQVADAILVFENDKVMYYPFGYDHYISRLKASKDGNLPALMQAKDAAMVEALAAVPKRERHETRQLSTEEAYLEWKLALAAEPVAKAAEEAEKVYERTSWNV